MATILREAPDKQIALEYVQKMYDATEQYSNLLTEVCIWREWREKTKDLLTVAIEQSGVTGISAQRGKSV